MSETPAVPVAPKVVAPAPAPAKPLTAIQSVEQEIGNFLRQKEQAIAQVHAVDGAIQAANRILMVLRAEAAKAEVEAKKLVGAAEADVKTGVADVESAAKAVKSEVVSIEDAVAKKI